MAWAIDTTTRRPVYVGQIPKERTGLLCNCQCPACGATLQAVNAGEKPQPGKHAPFFRHHTGQQGPSCKFRVAELAALDLLANRGEIVIPAPRRTAVRAGVSGFLYHAEQQGAQVVERIIERRNVSNAEVLLTLESGRQVVLVLRGHENVGEYGSVFAVISVQVDDPEVALLSPAEILERSQLTPEWVRLLKHQDDAVLQRAADDEARRHALECLDIDPAELNLPEGATRKQASESLLHWAIKNALLEVGSLRTPEHREALTLREADGTPHSTEFVFPSTRLVVRESVGERAFDGYRPDIHCLAHDTAGRLGTFALHVEVAVTSKVTRTKLELIERDGTACIELDVGRFSSGGRTTLTSLRQLVSEDVSCKAWLFHPQLSALRDQALAQLRAACNAAERAKRLAKADAQRLRQEREEEERQRLALVEEQRQATRRRLQSLRGLAKDAVAQELRRVLECRWEQQPEVSSDGTTWNRGEFELAAADVWHTAALNATITEPAGVAWRLSRISKAACAGEPLHYAETVPDPDSLRSWAGLLHLAIEVSGVSIAAGEEQAYSRGAQRVMDSLRAGESTYVRQTHLDELLAAMYPELGDVFAQSLGTGRYVDEVDAERRLRQEVERAADDALALAQREAELLACRAQSVGQGWIWKPLNMTPSAERAVSNLSLMTRPAAPRTELVALVRAAWDARQAGAPFGAWFTARSYASPQDVDEARVALETAFLIESKLNSIRIETPRPHRARSRVMR
ncbi:hypothetical protein IWX58_004772 [Rubrivivax gelatinosus]|nr:hypothetical protein [Rubrivivax gelatinosus]MBG6083022.1 hypothetical protein [Rubrivivax gelatinosus]